MRDQIIGTAFKKVIVRRTEVMVSNGSNDFVGKSYDECHGSTRLLIKFSALPLAQNQLIP